MVMTSLSTSQHYQRLLLAQSGHHDRAEPCLLLEVKRTSAGKADRNESLSALTKTGIEPSLLRSSAFAENRWDNLENKHWNTMGLLAKVGHAKDLKSEKFLMPPLGTFRQN
jgi:hypothetical protein